MAWKKDNEYFIEILPYSESSDGGVKSAAFKALANLPEPVIRIR